MPQMWIKIHGGSGRFSNMDKAGMFVDGFEQHNTMIIWYSIPYYRYFEQRGFRKEKE